MDLEDLISASVRASHNGKFEQRVQQDCNRLRATIKRRRDTDFELMNKGDEKNRLMSKN